MVPADEIVLDCECYKILYIVAILSIGMAVIAIGIVIRITYVIINCI